jgi:iron complex transport system substrate-binding protein
MRTKRSDPDQSSGAIDARVQSTRASGESLYRLDLERLAQLAPDVILTQDLCGVCSVTPDEVAAACRATGIDPTVVALTPRTLADVWTTVERIGAAIGSREAAKRLADELRHRSSTGPPTRGPAPRVAVLEWLDPPILAGLWTPEMVAHAGGAYLGPAPGQVGERSTWTEVLRLAPDLLVLSPCSFPIERTASELKATGLAAQLARAPIPLGIWLADEAYFSRPGPRLANGVELLRALTHQTKVPDQPPVMQWAASSREVVA